LQSSEKNGLHQFQKESCHTIKRLDDYDDDDDDDDDDNNNNNNNNNGIIASQLKWKVYQLMLDVN